MSTRRKKKNPARFVWCAEDFKYGVMEIYATKKAAEMDYGPFGKKQWDSGEGGAIRKWIVR